ncbi:helix-turn-helix domain-containing protein [Microcoleus sp. PH2017_08_TRC_O_A]|uniref:helix-turn-helix domain-containing protein n=1 Tax=Microcoleus sp. PH2017_08_TRC_O_A TaxID=2798819 RepID=UPI00341F67DE
MKARYQFRFYPSNQQQQSLAQLFGCVRVVWNDALAVCKQSEKNRNRQTFFIRLSLKPNKLRKEHG